MSSYFESYCNITTDLQAVEPVIDSYDVKRELGGWAATNAAKVYACFDCGHVTKLYRDGEDLGDAEASQPDVRVDGDWYYDPDADVVYLYSTNDPATTHRLEAGRKWSDVKTEAVAHASDFVRAYVSKPIIKRTGTGAQSESLRDYDDSIIRATATLACSYLIQPHDMERGAQLRGMVYNPGNPNEPGLLDMVRDGRIPLWNETSTAAGKGVVNAVSLDATTTGTIADVEGTPTVSFDAIKVVIETGGTITQGSTSTVTYSAYVAGSDGLKTTQVVDSEAINCQYQSIGQGMYARFTAGVYVAADEWEVEVRGGKPEAGTGRRTISLRRI
jgi:hypothetical protein